ncbi:sensor histidine kinase [Bermanella sp. WJH001]|uniref:sensor histidine kinase n=1 Tax=Bermanella sp. WJH001 TaxID=3048005 RepID=UPI0024BEEA70|nr:histidine kinase [Bermanella sp. WJH001]MDJ1538766.1 histidine kinase [Bermanella sp. WJH001]
MATSKQPIDAKELIPDLCQVRSVLWLILFSQALVIVLILLSSGAQHFSWEQFGLLSFYVQWLVLVSAACLCRLRLHIPALSLNQLTAISFVLIQAVNLLISLITLYGMNELLLESYSWDWLLRNQLISAILATLLLHYFYIQMQSRLHARSELQSRMQALQSRIRPHFLFNSMNIIASLIHVDPDKAEQAVEDLSELFRASLKMAGAQTTLQQEMDLCKKYINIEQLRLGERLTVKWQVEAPKLTNIPLLTLQPLIENAIYHGIAPSEKGGVVSINIYMEQSRLHIRVSNPICTVQHQRHESGNQMALENIQHRLQALYGHDASSTTEQDEKTFTIHLHYNHQPQVAS